MSNRYLAKLATISMNTYVSRIIMVFGLTIAISLMISPGYFIQKTFYGFFDHTSRTLYESIYGKSITGYTNLHAWLLQALDPAFVVLACVSAVSGILTHTYRNFFVSLWVTTAVGLTGIDVFNMLVTSRVEFNLIIENTFANILGGLLVSFALSVIMFGMQELASRSNLTVKSTCILSAISVSLFGIASSVFTFYVIVFFLHPLPVSGKISTMLPTSGVIGGTKSMDSHNSSLEEFALIPVGARIQSIDLTGTEIEGFHWKKEKSDTSFSFSLFAVSGCAEQSDLKGNLKNREIIFEKDVSEVRISVEPSMHWLQLNGRQKNITLSGSPISIFWLQVGQVASTRTITQFLGEGSDVHGKTLGSIDITVTGSLLDRVDSKTRLTSRLFSVDLNGKRKRIVFSPVDESEVNDPVECKIISAESVESNLIKIDGHIMTGIHFRIERSRSPTAYFNDFDGRYSILKPTGWFRAPNVDVDKLSSTQSGRIGLIQLRDSIEELQMNGKIRKLANNHRFQGHGNLRATYGKKGTLLVEGEYHAAWLDNERLNRTRWETWPIELKIAILSIFIPIVFWLRKVLSYAFKLWQQNIGLKW